MQEQSERLGIYTSYNEKKNGSFIEAVNVSNTQGYILWLDRSSIKRENFIFPTTIVIRITGKHRYYKGKLIDIKSRQEVDIETILNDKIHRPIPWQKVDALIYKDFKSVFYITELQDITRLMEICKKHPPQKPIFITFDN